MARSTDTEPSNYRELAQFCREMAGYYHRLVWCNRIVYQCPKDTEMQERLRSHYMKLVVTWIRREARMRLLARGASLMVADFQEF